MVKITGDGKNADSARIVWLSQAEINELVGRAKDAEKAFAERELELARRLLDIAAALSRVKDLRQAYVKVCAERDALRRRVDRRRNRSNP